jgi:formimidoylglutamate deiminase
MYIHNDMLWEEGKSVKQIFAKTALLPEGWTTDVRIAWVDDNIAEVTPHAARQSLDEVHEVILPGLANLHSHAFQRAMAGLAEVRGAHEDSFWSWRSLMYKFALKMSPDDIESVTAQAYMEMLERGFTRVGEFHYLHHDGDGRPYGNIAEHAGRIAAASSESGIGLTLLPVFYAHAGFGGQPPHAGQRRFVNTLEQFEKLWNASADIVAALPGAEIGLAPHSLRAVKPGELQVLISLAQQRPIHIHVAEQMQEVEDCLTWSGKRPVEWLLDNVEVGSNWCLVHATHMTDVETRRLARSGAIAGLCPITEANLGDGIFAADNFVHHGGTFGIGSDSNVQISVSAELRQLEYSQRLSRRARNILAKPDMSNGRHIYEQAMKGGAKALATTAGLVVGNAADFLSLDVSSIPFAQNDTLLDHWIFADGLKVDCVWAAGKKQVEHGQHKLRQSIHQQFLKTMKRLMDG